MHMKYRASIPTAMLTLMRPRSTVQPPRPFPTPSPQPLRAGALLLCRDTRALAASVA